MRSLSKALLLVAVLGLAACNNPDRYGAAGAGGMGGAGAGGAGGAGGIGTSGLGDPSNPASPAYFQQTVGDRVLFLVDQSTLTEAARTTLMGQAVWLNANADYAVIIEGHADEQGTREYNLALGQKRSEAVRKALGLLGVSEAQMEAVSFGKEKPAVAGNSEAAMEKNRRAEISVR